MQLAALIGNLWNRSTFSKKRALCCTSTQEEMMYEGSQGKAAPITRRRMTPPTPMQNSYTSFERKQGSYEGEGRGWNARGRTIFAGTKQHLERSYSVKVRVEELEGLLGPEDVDVDFRWWSRWNNYKRAPWRQDSSASASEGWW